MEAEAVISIIDRCESGEWEFCVSSVLFDEIDNTPNLGKKQKVMILYQAAKRHIDLNAGVITRAKELEHFSRLMMRSTWRARKRGILMFSSLRTANLSMRPSGLIQP
ncbi:hypothetical protein C4J81_19055 (plasmid) [Deltaproteobacteria bacterium Smac51]|nr:hypothetical protein C4J81_19055 [Deltaproteobacteria bacterium Smac51]